MNPFALFAFTEFALIMLLPNYEAQSRGEVARSNDAESRGQFIPLHGFTAFYYCGPFGTDSICEVINM